jgi:hypothetical protein
MNSGNNKEIEPVPTRMRKRINYEVEHSSLYEISHDVCGIDYEGWTFKFHITDDYPFKIPTIMCNAPGFAADEWVKYSVENSFMWLEQLSMSIVHDDDHVANIRQIAQNVRDRGLEARG